jgi:NAD(P)-dependent dehydrogenase (short-subunit alcohol dehydrogenase family)
VLAGYGVNVVIADINEADGKRAAQNIGARASFIGADITRDDDIGALVAKTVERHGRLDFLVNVACTYLDNGDTATRRLAEGVRYQHRRLHNANAAARRI